MTILLNAVRRDSEAHADGTGLAQTPIPGLTAVSATPGRPPKARNRQKITPSQREFSVPEA